MSRVRPRPPGRQSHTQRRRSQVIQERHIFPIPTSPHSTNDQLSPRRCAAARSVRRAAAARPSPRATFASVGTAVGSRRSSSSRRPRARRPVPASSMVPGATKSPACRLVGLLPRRPYTFSREGRHFGYGASGHVARPIRSSSARRLFGRARAQSLAGRSVLSSTRPTTPHAASADSRTYTHSGHCWISLQNTVRTRRNSALPRRAACKCFMTRPQTGPARSTAPPTSRKCAPGTNNPPPWHHTLRPHPATRIAEHSVRTTSPEATGAAPRTDDELPRRPETGLLEDRLSDSEGSLLPVRRLEPAQLVAAARDLHVRTSVASRTGASCRYPGSDRPWGAGSTPATDKIGVFTQPADDDAAARAVGCTSTAIVQSSRIEATTTW